MQMKGRYYLTTNQFGICKDIFGSVEECISRIKEMHHTYSNFDADEFWIHEEDVETEGKQIILREGEWFTFSRKDFIAEIYRAKPIYVFSTGMPVYDERTDVALDVSDKYYKFRTELFHFLKEVADYAGDPDDGLGISCAEGLTEKLIQDLDKFQEVYCNTGVNQVDAEAWFETLKLDR